MTDLSIFRYEGVDLYTVIVEGEPWFKVADVCAVLDIGNPSAAAARLDDDEVTLISTEGRPSTNFVSEAGLYALILGSRKPEARAFKRWVTHEVLPQIRRTGAYVAPVEPPEQLMARALIQAQGIIERKDERIAALTPRAEAWDELADAEGDYSVADAASILVRAGIETGPQRLFEKLGEMRWTYRGEGRRWRPYARTLDDGYLCERAMPPRTDHDGILVPVPPQVRITARGLERLRVRLGNVTQLVAVSQ